VKQPRIETMALQRIVGGGQTMGQLASGKKIFVWGGLPGETVKAQITKQKSSMAEGVVLDVLEPAPERIAPRDPESYLSTSPWQIMTFDAEQQHKAALIAEAFELHKITLPGSVEVWTDNKQFEYRNKVEFSWWWDNDTDQLDLAFFRRGSTGKVPVPGTSLARAEINTLAIAIRDLLRSKHVQARSLKTLLIRANQDGECAWQLYIKDRLTDVITESEAAALPARGGEIIYSDPKSPASRITERLASFGDMVLHDYVRDTPFNYATEGFFQVNIPVYEQALADMAKWIAADKPTVDMYSGVGSIGLTIGGSQVTLVEIDEYTFREMERNIVAQKRVGTARPVLAASEKALDYIDPLATLIVDPPRAGLHQAVIDRIREVLPGRIVYLSCNPVTQARDVSLLLGEYTIVMHRGYNFFPRTPHIENLVVLERR
jgi:23S rRNA (uracil1939-C5)-methyltransferase